LIYGSTETTKLAIDILYRTGQRAAAQALARAERQFLSADDCNIIEAALGR